jgi:polyisoprenoid-binding protein YceI
VHPYLDGDLLFLSCEIYSQFHCHTPIYSALDDPLIGIWDDRQGLFSDLGEQLEAEILRQMRSAPSRDAVAPVADSVPVVSWEALGLELPESRVASRAAAEVPITPPRQWVIDDAPETSSVLFRFAPPLDNYAGRAQLQSAAIDLGPQGLDGTEAVFRVAVSTITMGEPLLDRELQTPKFLHADEHPVSSFTMKSIEADVPRLRFGEKTNAMMRGTFRMKGRSIPIGVRAALEPVIDASGRPRLLMTADWSIRIGDPFGLEGPDGPLPARDTVLFSCHITLRPHTEGRAEENQP